MTFVACLFVLSVLFLFLVLFIGLLLLVLNINLILKPVLIYCMYVYAFETILFIPKSLQSKLIFEAHFLL